jgi:hypothetical protein
MYFMSSEERSSKLKDTVSTSDKIETNPIKKTDRLVLLKEEVDVDCENHRKHRSTPVAKFRLSYKYSFFAHVQTGPEAHPASCTMGTGSFQWVKRPGRGADHPPPSSAKVKKE